MKPETSTYTEEQQILTRSLRTIFSREESSLLLFLALLIVFFGLMHENFLSIPNVTNVVRQVVILAVAAFGATYVILSKGLDLSVGSVAAFSGVVAALVARELGPTSGPWVGYLVGFLAGFSAGLLNGIIITVIKINPIIATLATMTIIRGFAFILTGGVSLYGVPSEFQWLGRSYLFGRTIPIPVIVMIIVFVLCYLGLNRMFIGRHVYAIGGNEEAARLSGIPVENVKRFVYIVGGATAGLSGIILASRLGAGQAGAGTGFELDVITAVILGGVSIEGGQGKLQGTLLGVLIIGILSNGLTLLNVEPFYQLVIKGVALLLAVSLDRLRKQLAAG